MVKKHFLFTISLLISAFAFSGNINTITEKGAWCWFADPRALHYENETGTINSTYIGYIDVHGNIKATQINHLTNTTNEVLIRSYFQPDDHDNPTFLVLPDERVMIFYSRHTDEACFYYRISNKPGDITTLGKEVRLATKNNTTYPSPFILSDDPNHIYLCWRGISWHPTIARLTIPDANDKVDFDWGPYQIVSSKNGQRGVRPYAKYISNGSDKIYMAYTTTHPDNQNVNYIYCNYIDINTKELKDIKGNRLSIIGETELHNVDATQDYKTSYPDAIVDDTPERNWIWETTLDQNENPIIAMVSISKDKSSHDYFHVKWTGDRWQKTFLSNAGGHFHQSPNIEKCYSAGMAIDKTNPQVIYGSVPVNGKYGLVYELKKFTVASDGTLASAEQLTFDSEKNNVRPFVIANNKGESPLVWMYGDYYDWMVSSSYPKGYPTAIRTNMTIPSGNIDLQNKLVSQKSYNQTASEEIHNVRVPKTKTFTLVMTVSLDSASYFGEIIKFCGLTYGVSQDERPKPYLKSEKTTYSSTNVLGNSDLWQHKGRSTDGSWAIPTKFKEFYLAITYENNILRTYVDGLIDQYIEIKSLKIEEVAKGGFNGDVSNFKVYSRALTQDEIKTLNKTND